jgi:hypothetical protein
MLCVKVSAAFNIHAQNSRQFLKEASVVRDALLFVIEKVDYA